MNSLEIILFATKAILWIAWCCFSGFVLGFKCAERKVRWYVFALLLIGLTTSNILLWKLLAG